MITSPIQLGPKMLASRLSYLEQKAGELLSRETEKLKRNGLLKQIEESSNEKGGSLIDQPMVKSTHSLCMCKTSNQPRTTRNEKNYSVSKKNTK